MDVREICTTPVVACDPDTGVEEVARLMRDHGVGCVVVLRHGGLVGIVTDRDLVLRALATGTPVTTPVASVMSRDVGYVYEQDDITVAATVMATRGVRRLPVLSLTGEVTGMVAADDLAVEFADEISRLAFAVQTVRARGAQRLTPERMGR